MYGLGVDIGGTTVKIGIFREDGDILEKWEIPTVKDNCGEAILPDIAKSIDEKLKKNGIEKHDVKGIGVGVPAAVTGDGVVKQTANLGWGYKEVRRELEELTGLAVKVENDANVAALGEMWKGGGAGCENMIMVTLGTGVGGGVIIGGQIYSGVHGGAGEIAHICVNFDETESCGCGKKGCLEQYASATGIARLAKMKLADETRNTILKSKGNTAKDVWDAVKAGDEVAISIAQEFAKYLGRGLADLAAVVDPEIFVIGGGVSKAGDILITYVEPVFRSMVFFASKGIKFGMAELGNDAGICGAAKMVL